MFFCLLGYMIFRTPFNFVFEFVCSAELCTLELFAVCRDFAKVFSFDDWSVCFKAVLAVKVAPTCFAALSSFFFSGFFTQLHIIAFITARINLRLISLPQFI